MSERTTAVDLLRRLDGEACKLEDCAGRLERRVYKDTDAVVCTDCRTPLVRLMGS